MRAALEAVGTVLPAAGDDTSSTGLAAAAAGRALAAGAVDPDDVGMIVNAAVYHDDNVMEPANATFVQRALGANLQVGVVKGAGTLAFDLTNGGAGLLTGLQVVAGFVETGDIAHGLVVTGDVDPTPGVSQGLAHVPAGAAVLVGPGTGEQGFAAFCERSYPEFADLYRASLDWDGRHHAVHVHEDQTWAERWLGCAEDALKAFLDDRRLAPAEVDLLVTAPPQPDAGAELCRRAGLDPARLVLPPDAGGPLHTAGLGMALAAAMAEPAWERARRVLLLAGGAGITITIAEYRGRATR